MSFYAVETTVISFSLVSLDGRRIQLIAFVFSSGMESSSSNNLPWRFLACNIVALSLLALIRVCPAISKTMDRSRRTVASSDHEKRYVASTFIMTVFSVISISQNVNFGTEMLAWIFGMITAILIEIVTLLFVKVAFPNESVREIFVKKALPARIYLLVLSVILCVGSLCITE